MAVQPGRRAVVVVDDGVDAAVHGGEMAHVRGGQPAEGGAPHPAARAEQLTQHTVIGSLGVELIGLVRDRVRVMPQCANAPRPQ